MTLTWRSAIRSSRERSMAAVSLTRVVVLIVMDWMMVKYVGGKGRLENASSRLQTLRKSVCGTCAVSM